MKTRTRTVGDATITELTYPGLSLFARPLAPDWRERNAPRWAAALRPVAGLQAVTLAEIRWPGIDESRFGVALWVDERTRSSSEARRAVVNGAIAAVVALPPRDKVLLVVEDELDRLFCDVDEPVFVGDPAAFASRRQAARARGPANVVTSDPFERQ